MTNPVAAPFFAALVLTGLALGPVALVAEPTQFHTGPADALHAQLAARMAEPRFRGAAWGVKIVSLDSGRTVFEHQADLRLSPASNSKLYVAGLALARLGGDYRIVTPLLGTAPVSPDGELPGDLVIAGRGDPSWNPRLAKADFWSAFDPFVAALQRAGVRRIRGDVIADATWLRVTPHGAGWTADDLNYEYGAEISSVSFTANYVDLRVTPAAEPGHRCEVELLQPLSGLVLDNRTVTSEVDTPPALRVLRLPGEEIVRVFGGLPAGGKELLTEATVPRPAAWFATALKEALNRQGITVDGIARSVRWPERPHAGAGDVQLGEVHSPPLREMVIALMQPSENLATDLVFAHLGELRRTPETPPETRSDELALLALDEFLLEVGVVPGDVIFEEGSGLSRNNLTTAAATVRLLEYMTVHREAEAFVASLPVAGRSGTLLKRMKDSPAEANVQAKTGTLRWASALSGYVRSAAGERLVFSLMLNRHLAPPSRKTREALDEIAVLLATSAGGG